MKYGSFVIIVAFFVGESLCGIAMAQTRAKRPTKSSLAPTTRKSDQPTEYQRLLIAYLTNIERIEKDIVHKRTQRYRKVVASEKTGLDYLAKHKLQVLKGLQEERKKRRNQRLDFMGECYENMNPFVIGISPESADIAKALYEDGAFAPITLGDIVNILKRQDCSPGLCRNWSVFLKALLAKSEKDSELWRKLVKILYGKGNLRSEYHADVYRLAKQFGDVEALELMLFQKDALSGQPKARLTLQGLSLMKEFSARHKKYPRQGVTCALYAFRVRDYGRAHRLCEDILRREYLGTRDAKVRKKGPPPEDYDLSAAKVLSMHLLFYGLKNDQGLRAIYDRASIRKEELRRPVPIEVMPRVPGAPPYKTPPPSERVKPWVSYTAYSLGSSEIDYAAGYIGQVRSWIRKEATDE